jgi:hypothetical protein
MPETGAVLATRAAGKEWAFYSKRGNGGAKLRFRSTRGWDEKDLSADEFRSCHQISKPVLAATGLVTEPWLSDRLSKEDYAGWELVLGRLDRLWWTANEPRQEKAPQTRLRELYDSIWTGSSGVRTEALSCLSKMTVDELAAVWNDSVATMEPFWNCDQGWNGDNRKALRKVRPLREATDGLDVQAVLANQGSVDIDEDELYFVAREISPRRITAASDSGSGDGGIDALLKNTIDEPIVAEIKGPNDSGPAYALVQAMAYASELATLHQMCRLKRHLTFPRMKELEARVHVLVLLVNKTDEQIRQELEVVRPPLSEVNRRIGRFERLGSIRVCRNVGEEWQMPSE